MFEFNYDIFLVCNVKGVGLVPLIRPPVSYLPLLRNLVSSYKFELHQSESASGSPSQGIFIFVSLCIVGALFQQKEIELYIIIW
jgi:hypothetical protein